MTNRPTQRDPFKYLTSIEDQLMNKLLDQVGARFLENNAESFPYLADGHGHVKFINLKNFALRTLPDPFPVFPHLIELDISDNLIESLPENLGSCQNLKVLNAKNNHLHQLPRSFRQFTHLTNLNFNNNQFERFPESILTLQELRVLQMNDNKIRHLPLNIDQLSNLTEIYLAHNAITSIPARLGRCNRLRVCDVRFNKLTQIPLTLLRSHTLSYFFCSHNRITDLPEIPPLAERLYLNKLRHFRAPILEKRELMKLDMLLSDVFESIDDAFGITMQSALFAADHVIGFDFDDYPFELIMQPITRFPHLNSLSFNSTDLNWYPFPSILTQLSHLNHLTLVGGNLRILDPAIGMLHQLESLNVSRNQLTTLPNSLSALTKLKVLDLSNNAFRAVPWVVQVAPQLQKLNLEGNPIETLPWLCARDDVKVVLWDFFEDFMELNPLTGESRQILELAQASAQREIDRQNTDDEYLAPNLDTLVEDYIHIQMAARFSQTLPLLLLKIENNQPLDALDLSHPQFPLWRHALELKCAKHPTNTAASMQAHLEQTQQLLPLQNQYRIWL